MILLEHLLVTVEDTIRTSLNRSVRILFEEENHLIATISINCQL